MAEVKFLVTIDPGTSEATIKKLEDSLKDLAGTTKEAGEQSETADRGWMRLFGTFTAGAIAADLVTGALRKVGDILKDTIKAAANQEEADKRLRASLILTGRESEQAVQHFRSLAGELQNLTRYSDDAIQQTQALLITMTDLDGKGIEEATKAVIGLSSALGLDLQQATMVVVKALEGNTGALSRYGIKIDETLSKEEKKRQVLEKLGRLYKLAEDETNTFSGSLDQLKNVLADAQEEIGNAVVLNEDFRKAIHKITQMVRDMIPELKDYAKTLSDIVSAIADLATWAMDAWKKFRESIGGLSSNLTEVDKALDKLNQKMGGFSNVVKLLQLNMRATGSSTQELEKINNALWESYNEVGVRATLTKLALGDFGEKAQQSFKRIAGPALEAIEKLGGLQKAGEKIGPPIKSGTDQAGEGLDELAWRAMGAYSELYTLWTLSKAISGEKPPTISTGGLAEAIGGNLGKLLEYKAVSQETLNELKRGWEGLESIVTKSDIRNRISALQAAMQVLGDELPQDEIARLREEVARLQGQLKDPGWLADFKENLNNFANTANDMIGRLNQIFGQAQRNREIAIENEYKKRLKHINDTIKDEEKRNEAVMALEAEFQIKKTEAKRAAAKQEKAVALMGAVVETARAITEALPNLILAGVVAALGAVQIATIAAQPIPLARGAVFEKPTLLASETGQRFLVGEAGTEILLPETKLREILRSEAAAGPIQIEIPIAINLGDRTLEQTILKTINRTGRSGELKLNLNRVGL